MKQYLAIKSLGLFLIAVLVLGTAAAGPAQSKTDALKDQMVIKALEDLSFEDLNTPPEREKVAEQTKASPAKEGAAEVKQAKAEPGGPPQMVTLDAAQGKASGMYTPVEFDHALHMATGGCTDCHHSYEQTGAYQPCSSCHQPQAEAASAKLSLYNAYHNQQGQASCLGCHLEAQSGPTGCQGCHIPD